jgi:tricorn protease
MNRTQIVSSYAGDLWTVSRQGGAAARLTAGMGIESNPGVLARRGHVAFTGEYDGNGDVYTVPSNGGIPKRVTYHADSRVYIKGTT